MGRTRSGVFLVAAAAAALLSPPAQAGTITRDPNPPCCSGALTVRYTAAGGETNNVTFTRVELRTIQIEDVVPITVTAGITDCSNLTATKVQCANLNYQGWNVFVDLGDLGDTSSAAGAFAAYTVDGGDGNDVISGGEGHDSLSGGLGNDTLTGSTGNDILNGGHGNDALQGTIGDDTLDGGPGVDLYLGGDGDDRLINSYSSDDLNGNAGMDTVDYSVVGASYDPSCLPVFDCPIGVHVTFDGVANDGSLDLDMDFGTEPGDNVRDDVEAVIGSPHPDTLNGGVGALNQTFSGIGGNDTINGGGGTDLLRESGGPISVPISMTLAGGTLTGYFGTDTFTAIENVELNGGARDDTIDASAYSGPVTLRGSVGVGGGDGNDRLIGGSGNDTLVGGDACCLYQDSDTLTGGPGDDTLNLGTAFGFDVVEESGDVNFTLTNTQLTGLGTDTFVGTANGAVITGGAGNNVLNASAFASGPVTLDGAGGIDTLTGSPAADALTGGPGNDVIDGAGNAGDRLVETANANMTLSDANLSGPGTGTDSIVNVELATLNGGAGANVLNAAGFSGPVTVNAGAGSDTVTGGSGADTLNGGDGADALNGGDGADALNGGDGADALNGGAAGDTLHGGDGDDTLVGGADAVNDTLDGDAGVNRVAATGDGNFALSNTNLVGQGNDSLVEIQRATLTGGPGDNALNAATFTLGPVILNGEGGADTLLGGSDADTLVGGAGADSYDAGAGADTIQTRDGVTESSIVCGDDADTAVVDTADVTNADCETVSRPDVTAPQTTIGSGPKAKTKARTARLVFFSTEESSTFQCKLDRGPWKACTSPKTYKKLKPGRHVFQVRAKDKAGNVDRTPAKKTWRIL
jgi:Ca2+-binding RTX toxin-like protein